MNRTDTPVRVLMLSSLIGPDIVHYVDSGKVKASAAAGRRGADGSREPGCRAELLLVRFVGEHAARQAWPGPAQPGTRTRRRRSSSCSSRRTSMAGAGSSPPPQGRRLLEERCDQLGLFGVAWGSIVGFAAGDGGSLESGLVIGVLWGLSAWSPVSLRPVGGVSARRLKGLGTLPPDTSLAVA